MERTLSLILNGDFPCPIGSFKSLTLEQKDNDKLDYYTTKNFETSEQIREKYKLEIEEFLKDNVDYLNGVKEKTGKSFKGRIVVLGMYENGIVYQRRVLYKKHLISFNEIIKDKLTMQRFIKREKVGVNEYGFKRLISPFLTYKVQNSNYQINSQVELLKKELKKDKKSFYDILRIICKSYELEREYRPKLRTIEALYKMYIDNNRKEVIDIEEEEAYFLIDGVKYCYNDIPFDLDDIKRVDSTYVPDGLGIKK